MIKPTSITAIKPAALNGMVIGLTASALSITMMVSVAEDKSRIIAPSIANFISFVIVGALAGTVGKLTPDPEPVSDRPRPLPPMSLPVENPGHNLLLAISEPTEENNIH
jgi:hypothetical protein